MFEAGSGRGSVHHNVCKTCFFGKGHLALNASKRFCTGEPVPFLESSDLGFSVGGDDDDRVDALVHTGFEEERHFIDSDGSGSPFGDSTDEARLFAGHSWMDDTFKLPQFASVVKDDSAERMAIDGTVRAQDGLAETFYDLTPRRLTRLHHLSSESVGIDDRRATALEHLCDSAFSRRDTSCEPHHDHATENTMGHSKKSLGRRCTN